MCVFTIIWLIYQQWVSVKYQTSVSQSCHFSNTTVIAVRKQLLFRSKFGFAGDFSRWANALFFLSFDRLQSIK